MKFVENQYEARRSPPTRWEVCWQFLAMDCAHVVQFNVLVPVGDEQVGH